MGKFIVSGFAINEINLVKYRDHGMSTYTYFWINRNNNVISPYFDSQTEAYQWLDTHKQQEK